MLLSLSAACRSSCIVVLLLHTRVVSRVQKPRYFPVRRRTRRSLLPLRWPALFFGAYDQLRAIISAIVLRIFLLSLPTPPAISARQKECVRAWFLAVGFSSTASSVRKRCWSCSVRPAAFAAASLSGQWRPKAVLSSCLLPSRPRAPASSNPALLLGTDRERESGERSALRNPDQLFQKSIAGLDHSLCFIPVSRPSAMSPSQGGCHPRRISLKLWVDVLTLAFLAAIP